MKKLIIYGINCMFAVSIMQRTSCQSFVNLVSLESKPKKIVGVSSTAAPNYINEINTKAVRAFIKDFKNAQNVTWRKAADGGYIAQFNADSVQTTVAYNSNGSFSYELKRYSENKLAPALRKMIKSTYFDYNIIEITEIELPRQKEEIIFQVLIKFGDNFKILRICNREIETTGDYTRP